MLGKGKCLLDELNDTEKNYPLDMTLHRLFEQQVERTPDAIAVEFDELSISYRELDTRANHLAHYLKESGTMSGHMVAVFMTRSIEMVIALLGVLKAGAAYVPLDPEYPLARTSFMIRDANPTVILTLHFLQNQLPPNEATIVCLDSQWDDIVSFSGSRLDTETTADDIAYVIYTSGTTGNPKGVLNLHRGITNRILWMQDCFNLTVDDRVLQKTPYSFDVSVWEFFWPLSCGARLIVARHDGHKDPVYLSTIINDKEITALHFVPSMLKVYLDHADISIASSLKHVFCSGERLTPLLQQQFFCQSSAQLYNLYGPTEAAIDVTYWKCLRDDSRQYVPIGRPIANTKIYILDAGMQPLQPGEEGELYIGGVQVAAGYLNLEQLSKEKFVRDIFSNDDTARLYRTGDFARFHTDGYIEYTGRIDQQVKVSGIRIELNEIEAILLQHHAVVDGAVTLREDRPGVQRLVAYVVVEQGYSVTITDIRQHVLKQLPHYMVPQNLVILDSLPLSPAGKLDRNALPPVPLAPPRNFSHRVIDILNVPQNRNEVLMANIWEELLDINGISAHDMFFDLGGDSLLTLNVVDRFERQTGIRLNPGHLITQTLRQLISGIEPVNNATKSPGKVTFAPAEPDTSEIMQETTKKES